MWAVGNKKNNLGKKETDVGTARLGLWNGVCGSPRVNAFAGLLKTALGTDTKTWPTMSSYVCSAGSATLLVKTAAGDRCEAAQPRHGPQRSASLAGWRGGFAFEVRPGSLAAPLPVLRDDQVDVRGDVAVKPERNLVLTELLQGVLEVDLAAVDLDLVLEA